MNFTKKIIILLVATLAIIFISGSINKVDAFDYKNKEELKKAGTSAVGKTMRCRSNNT